VRVFDACVPCAVVISIGFLLAGSRHMLPHLWRVGAPHFAAARLV